VPSGDDQSAPSLARRRWLEAPWLNWLSLGATLYTALAVGTRLQANFDAGRPPFPPGILDLDSLAGLILHPQTILAGLPYAVTLLAIIAAHELGHYFACRRHGVAASAPYFVPDPFFLGSLGGRVLVRGPIYSRRVLFDIGVAGPLAGFAVAVPALIIGMALSKKAAGIGDLSGLEFGGSLFVDFVQGMFFPALPDRDVYYHPMARAAWFGLLATALNLLPAGTLDGGYLVWAVTGRRKVHAAATLATLGALVPLSVFFLPWMAWAAVLFVFARRHPYAHDLAPLDVKRVILAVVALLIFVVSFMPAPIRYGG